MIIELKLKNWMSFRDETVFSLVASGEKRLLARVPTISKTPVLHVSPVAVLYGGNAAGKTNLFSLFYFLRRLVLSPLNDEKKEIPLKQFSLFSENKNKITEIDLTFLASNKTIFLLHLVLSKQAVLEESLSIIKPTKVQPLYSRIEDCVTIKSTALRKNPKIIAFSQIIKQNQLFLSLVASEHDLLQRAKMWFSSSLNLIGTRSSYGGFGEFLAKPERLDFFAKLLHKFDTGICKLEIEDSSESALPPGILEEIKEDLSEDTMVNLNLGGSRFFVTKSDDSLTIKKLVSYHRNETGELIKFDLRNESEGTLRLIDVLPAFMNLENKNSDQVYIIDELDRSWHYLLSKQLIGTFLGTCSNNSRSQLIFSTHDLLLMDQDIFRKNEMFVVERNADGVSSLYSLNNPCIRYDKDLRKMYLQGKLGGVPQLSHFGSLTAGS